MSLKVLIVGNGQMGMAVADVLNERGHQVVDTVGSRGNHSGQSLTDLIQENEIDIAIEFTLPDSAKTVVSELLSARIPVVSGTTGWCPRDLEQLAMDNGIPLLHAANFSIGVAVMKKATELVTKALGPFPEFEPAIFERHHNRKKDSPSGTAKMLGDIVSEHGPLDQIQITSARQGRVAGEHTLIFEGEAESLEIVHRAHSRKIFAIGAVKAAEWLSREECQGIVDFETFLEGSLQWPTHV